MVAADKLGAVPYTMNKDVFNIALELWQQGYEVGQLVSSKAMEFNPYPVDGKPEVVLEWNRHATKVYTYNQQTHGRRLYYTRTMAIIKAYSELPEFYFLWVADSRGRLYPQTSTLLSPQGHDFGKALLLFKNKKPLEDRGLYHLHCAVAEHYGVDKVSIEDRYQWTKDNLGMVLEVGTTHTTGLWENADSPWQYLAACIELTNALSLDDPATYECGLAKFMDGKCSGAQHWAAMLKDEDTGKSVGLTPSSVEGDPPDLYSEVLQTWVEGLLSGRWADDRGYDTWAKELVLSGAMSRVWAKSPVMTYLYGSKIITWSRHITQCLRDSIDTTDIDDLGKRAYWLASCLSNVMEDRLSSIVVGMGWITSCIRILNCVTDDIKFISSSGFEINMRYRKSVSKQKKIVCLIFKTPIKYSLNEDTEELNRCKQSGAAAPNFIHSQDAAHLSNSVIASADQGLDIQVIHDCFGTHMRDVDSMTTMVKQQFIDMYESDMLTELRDYWVSVYGVELPELPRYGDLDLTQMKDSVYAFSG
jgi:DNA-directed RNA polymerase